ncbi:MAG TPA: ABC transporter permease [Gaiellaceae bacterium]|nr:ABC transporter permease [Gaiellaceae bacterium]
MTIYVLRRLIWGVVVAISLTFITFAVFRLIPYNPGYILAGPKATPAQLRVADHKLGVDVSLWHQYGRFLWRLAHADLGTSFTGEHINPVIVATLPVTGLLVLGGMLIMLAIALPLAVLSARRAGSAIDQLVLAVSVLGIAMHPFVVGVVLKQIFGVHLGILPLGGYCPMHHVGPSHGEPGTYLTPGELSAQAHGGATCAGSPWPWLWFSHMILPSLTFAFFFLPFYVRILRTRLVESYAEPWVNVARAKGASELRIVMRHLLRVVAGTTAAMLALDIGTAVTASIYIETIYNLPGLGHLALTALGANSFTESGYDLPTMAAIVLIVAVTIVVLNLLADLLAKRLDPRIKLTS